jgi:putative CocE/NonD family hydrolase
MTARILVDRNVPIPMRDGVRLKADIYRPDTPQPLPVILCRLPYNKDDPYMQIEAVNPIRAAEAGYAVVYQDTRGRYQSEGQFYPFRHEGQDGFDTIEWIARQPWCSGPVGMSGASYFGATQWLAAIEQPPHLKAIFPVITASEYYDGWTYQGGAFQLGFVLLWTLTSLAPDSAARLAVPEAAQAEMERYLTAGDGMDELYRRLPLSGLPLLGSNPAAAYLQDWLEHDTRDEYWDKLAVNRQYARIQVPAFNIGAWYDLFLQGTLENFTRMQAEGGSDQARRGQRLLVAPWAHGNFSAYYPHFNFGYAASSDAVDLGGLALRFFDQHLKGLPAQLDEDRPVRLFVMGENRWRDETAWPLPGTDYVPWYLHSQGTAGSQGGSLSPQPPGEEPADAYLYDPRQPAPTLGGPTFLPGLRFGVNAGPIDQRPVESRPDVLAYTSEPFQTAVEVTGPLVFHLWAASSAQDTDFVVRLCDVFPDGASRLLADGILRASSRQGLEARRWLEPGKVYEFVIDLVATGNVFLPGHRLRVDITSSSAPRFNPHPNTTIRLSQYTAADMLPALQTIFHDSGHPSHILLPVIAARK